ncbi:MAG: hypothetical protein HYZ42_17170 [Bacteroidetes bacterium]|nr:hypothetical protein [Bacteroidota bacterium]
MKYVFIFFIIIELVSCVQNSSGSERNKNKVIEEKLPKISRIPVGNVSFNYQIRDTLIPYQAINYKYIRCSITNNNSDEIYFLSSNAYYITEFFVCKDQELKVVKSALFDRFYWEIDKIDVDSTISFDVVVYNKLTKDSQIGVDFRRVDKLVPFKILRENQNLVEKITIYPIDSAQIIWGNR